LLQVITFLVVVNMYIAVILENFSQATADVQTGLTPDDFEIYYEKWEKYDQKASGYMPLSEVNDFVDELEPPLRLPKPNRLKLAQLDVPICAADRCWVLAVFKKNFLKVSLIFFCYFLESIELKIHFYTVRFVL